MKKSKCKEHLLYKKHLKFVGPDHFPEQTEMNEVDTELRLNEILYYIPDSYFLKLSFSCATHAHCPKSFTKELL